MKEMQINASHEGYRISQGSPGVIERTPKTVPMTSFQDLQTEYINFRSSKPETSLLTLPPELLLIISEYLAFRDLLNFKLVCKQLNACTKQVDKHDASKNCARRFHGLSNAADITSLRLCILCTPKVHLRPEAFNSSTSPAIIAASDRSGNSIDVVKLPMHVCSRHVSGLLTNVVTTTDDSRIIPGWYSHIAKFCRHCQQIWHIENRNKSKCTCNCKVCSPKEDIRVYTRYYRPGEPFCAYSLGLYPEDIALDGPPTPSQRRKQTHPMERRLFVREKIETENRDGYWPRTRYIDRDIKITDNGESWTPELEDPTWFDDILTSHHNFTGPPCPEHDRCVAVCSKRSVKPGLD
ncbi:hypothetical protein EJ05DRAFT_39776 [Pseudovirgaria hyperparasitica]|uniref:F-box domain-containing protein n=1 Tax=Pseudovirgaria hyperparasitica TaxID=470096 RepID=A0A6A6WMN4_9PEZI|nr:uncharacterized protein EJ05DRAFT_39776 [Pseudovirgaria hyperparasitica]KAF2763471.1 hypothetical protein EJ05DRAFT_39776 [Pseudovirgaria hyperparasitica]